MDLYEFREEFLNEIKSEAYIAHRYPIEVFIDKATDILRNDYSILTDLSQYYVDQIRTFGDGEKFKSMHIDGAGIDYVSNTINLLYADYSEKSLESVTNTTLQSKAKYLLGFVENCLKGHFKNAEMSDPPVQLAHDIVSSINNIYKIHLFFITTNKLSEAIKSLKMDDVVINARTFKVELDTLDIDGIFKTKSANFKKSDIVINCKDYGIKGIPCIKADIETDQYESYLAIVPGNFLSEIYKQHSSRLLETNVRSFLKFNGSINKGIRGTILNDKSKFFTYNNGISTTAKNVTVEKDEDKGYIITSFTNFQIVNGGQTTATLAATSIQKRADLSGIYVQMKLTILKENDAELIRNIVQYANSQNKVKTADLNSSHPFYVRMEQFSGNTYAPKSSGTMIPTLWFFERTRGQYEQKMMQMTQKQKNDYKKANPKNQKFTLADLAKYLNADACLPYFVSWGGEVNSAHFHNAMKVQWDKDNTIYNGEFYKKLIAKKILFKYIEDLISEQEWYIERRAYRPQLVAYTFSKLVYEAKSLKKLLNYRKIWNLQKVPATLYSDISKIAKLVFDTIYDENRSTTNIETYCKKTECWEIVRKKQVTISSEALKEMISQSDEKTIENEAKQEQKMVNGLNTEISIFTKGSQYWQGLKQRGQNQGVITYADVKALDDAINYCNGKYFELSKKQIKSIQEVVAKLKENMIE